MLVLSLLVVWLFIPAVGATGSLTVLFLYSFPSEFLVGLVPHEPVLILYGELHSPLLVATVAVAGTVLAEWLNYSFLSFFTGGRLDRRVRRSRTVSSLTRLFDRAPFFAVCVAGFSPVPFFPIRFLVVMTSYPVDRYLLGVLISRAPRFYLLAVLGSIFHFPTWLLVALFALLLVPVYGNILGRFCTLLGQRLFRLARG